jgi:hypothetical protein
MLIDSMNARAENATQSSDFLSLHQAHLRGTIFSVIDDDDNLLLSESIKLSRYPIHLLIELSPPSFSPQPTTKNAMNSQFHFLLFNIHRCLIGLSTLDTNIILVSSHSHYGCNARESKVPDLKHLSILILFTSNCFDIKIYLMDMLLI